MNKLVVIPSDLISDYEAKGTSTWLEEYYNPKGFFDEVYVLSPIEKLHQEKFGLKIIPVTSNKDFRNKLKKINPLCVRSYGGYWATDYANFNRVSNIPVVSSVHDTNPKLIHESLKFSDFVLSMSEAVSGVLLKNELVQEQNTFILGNRIDTNEFKRRNVDNSILKKFNIPSDKKIILHVGRKVFQKNIENVIKSLKDLDEEYILVLVGLGDFSVFLDIVNKLNLSKRVFNIEKVENKQLPLFYNLANVLCVPSRWEGFGLVFAEAASCLTKIVTSNIAPMNNYLINDGVMNILVDDYENSEFIARAINDLSNNSGINNDTRNLIIKKFDKKVVSQLEVELYEKIIFNNKTKSLNYKIWYLNYWFKKEFQPNARRILRLPKRIWIKIRSYQ